MTVVDPDEVKVAVMVVGILTVTVHVPVVPAQSEPEVPPFTDHPLNIEPLAAVAVKVTTVKLVTVVLQTFAGGEGFTPQLIIFVVELPVVPNTSPYPFPALVTLIAVATGSVPWS